MNRETAISLVRELIMASRALEEANRLPSGQCSSWRRHQADEGMSRAEQTIISALCVNEDSPKSFRKRVEKLEQEIEILQTQVMELLNPDY